MDFQGFQHVLKPDRVEKPQGIFRGESWWYRLLFRLKSEANLKNVRDSE